VRRALLLAAVAIGTAGAIAGAIWGGLEGGDRLWPVTWISWAPVGALILWRRPGNGVGVTMLGIGLGWGISFLCLAIAYNSLASREVRVWAEWVNVVVGTLPWLGIIWLLLIFPSGRLTGRLDVLAGLGVGLVSVLALFSFAFGSAPMEATGAPSPLAIEWLSDATSWFTSESGFYVVIVVTAMAILSMALRWRRSSGAERHQYRWLVLGAVVFLAILAMGQVLPEDNAAMYLWVLAGSAIPVAVGVAVSRYRLFEIDRMLSRTVAYAVVAGLLASLFGLVVVGLPNWIPGVDESPLLVAAATLGVAALFNPLRRRVQQAVDRRFNRSRYDAERVMDDFAGRLREQLDPGGVAQGWAQVVSDTMQPASVGMWIKI